MHQKNLGEVSEEKQREGCVGNVITSDKHAVVFNYQVFTLLPHTSIAQTPQQPDTVGKHAINKSQQSNDLLLVFLSCVGQGSVPPPLRSTCLSSLPKLIYLGDKQVDKKGGRPSD